MIITELKEKARIAKEELDAKQANLDAIQAEIVKEEAYLKLNDLYLDIQAGKVKLTKSLYWRLQELLQTFETFGSTMYEWWWKEFQRLPGWLNV